MAEMVVRAAVEARLNWDYRTVDSRVRSLTERGARAQWSVQDIDWSTDVPFGHALPDDSAFAMSAFEASPLVRYGRPMWDTFRWELQSWMVSQFLHGEQAALVVAGRLVGTVPDLESKLYAAAQAVDEARHVQVFSRYLEEKVEHPFPVSESLRLLLGDILGDARWDVTALGMQVMVEALAMASFRLADTTFHDDLIKDIIRLVARDEARHVTFGILTLGGLYDQMSAAELADREDLVLESASLIRRRFLLEDIWERLDVSRTDGAAFAANDDMMVRYRQVIFSRVVSSLARIGLMTERVRAGLVGLGLVGVALPGTGTRAGGPLRA